MKFELKLAIFDLDGTLIHMEHEYFIEKSMRVLPELGFPDVTREEYSKHLYSHDTFGFVPEEIKEVTVEKFWKIWDASDAPPPRPISGAAEALGQLSRFGAKIALATARNSPTHKLEKLLENTGFMDHFSKISTWALEPTWRDKVEQLKRVCSDLGVHPSGAFMAGDMISDITSAKSAGIGMSIGLLSGGVGRRYFEEAGADLILDDLTLIPRALGIQDLKDGSVNA